METADAVVVGGGCSGTSIALHLARRGIGRVVLLEKSTLASGATGRSSAIVRQHYAHESLAKMALAALRVFQNFAEEIGGRCDFRPVGFLVLVGPGDVEALKGNVALQRRVGVHTHVLQPDEVRRLDPRINLEDVGAAAFEPESGYADPASTTAAYANAAQRLGVEIRQETEVTGLVARGGKIATVETTRGPIATGVVVVAAGYRGRDLVRPFGVELPVTPVRHSIAIFERPRGFGTPHVVVSDRIQRAYFRPEGDALTLVGSSDPTHGFEDPEVERDVKIDLSSVSDYALRLTHRLAGGENWLVRRGYTGVYDTTPDRQPILGSLPGVEGVYCAFGFSGHGFKLSPMVGRALADLICDGSSSLVDLRLFRPSRFAEGALIPSAFTYSSAMTG